MGKRRDISDSDRNLFRSSIGEVTLITHDQAASAQNKPRSKHHLPAAARHGISAHTVTARPVDSILEAGDRLNFKRAGVQTRTLEKLRRGQIALEAELDLHGMTVTEATAASTRFLEYCRMNDYGCVRIIHGKGRGSKDSKPALKNHLNHWLRHQSAVQAFISAAPRDGGTGAVYVLLKYS